MNALDKRARADTRPVGQLAVVLAGSGGGGGGGGGGGSEVSVITA